MRFLLSVMLIVTFPVCAWASKVALVIGNSEYRYVEPLTNPVNDAVAVSDALLRQGFEVIKAINLERGQMYNVLRDFRNKADVSDLAMVYYAGHGIEIGGQNYLIPVDARSVDERDAKIEMVAMDAVLAQLSGARKLKMVVLDACRNNPFVAKMQRENQGRNIGRGLALVESAEPDTLIAYAAATGEITPDGVSGDNSPFTAAFLNAISGPTADVRIILGAARDELRLTVPGASPFVYSSLGREQIIINPNGSKPKPELKVLDEDSLLRDFATAEFSGSIAAWDEFLEKYSDFSSHTLYIVALRSRRHMTSASVVTNRSSEASIASNSDAIETTTVPQSEATEDVVSSQNGSFKSIQSFLKDRNCYRGAIDGIWGRRSNEGLRRFAAESGTQVTISRNSSTDQVNRTIMTIGQYSEIICAPQMADKPVRAPVSSPETTAKPAQVVPQKADTTAPKRSKRSWDDSGYCQGAGQSEVGIALTGC